MRARQSARLLGAVACATPARLVAQQPTRSLTTHQLPTHPGTQPPPPPHLDERGLSNTKLHALVRRRHAVGAEIERGQQVGGCGGDHGAEGIGKQRGDGQALRGARMPMVRPLHRTRDALHTGLRGGAGLAGLAVRLRSKVDVPLLDGVAAAISMAESLARQKPAGLGDPPPPVESIGLSKGLSKLLG